MSPRGYPFALGEPPSPDKIDRMTQLVFGHDVTFHPVGNTPIAANAGSPDEQMARRINALFHEGNAGKPHLLPEAEELLREFKAYKSRKERTNAKSR